jgi:arylsulfatase B
MKQIKWLLPIIGIAIISACKKEQISVSTVESPNILLIIADDLGKDAINGFTEGSIKPHTPHLDSIRNAGVSFSNFWVYPTCSPTRASIITGKYGYRTGVKWASDELSQAEITLQQHIGNETGNKYASAVIGKWHLSGNNTTVNPEDFGIDHYEGLIRGAAENYYQWLLTEDGSTSTQTEYATEFFTNRSVNWVNEQSKPWFLWLAYNAPHTPFHLPPSNMHNQGLLPDYASGMDEIPYYLAAIEAMDYQIGLLLDNIPDNERENTLIIFIGDNGTPGQVAQPPYSPGKAKGSLYQGGINVPMFVSGCGVSRTGVDDNLISSTDIFATISEVAGSSTNPIHDSKSFKSLFSQSYRLREFQYSEMDDGTTDAWTISNGDFKLIVNSDGTEQMFNLQDDSYETTPLILMQLTTEAANTKTVLEEELSRIRN